MKAKIKKFMIKALAFTDCVVGIIGIIFSITGAVRCYIHFIERTTPTFPEYLGLITVILISGVAGIAIYEITDIDACPEIMKDAKEEEE